MDDLLVKHPYPFYQNTLDFYLKMLLLLKTVMHNQSLTQQCPMRMAAGGFPNFTAKAGSPFFFQLPLLPGYMQLCQLFLGDGGSTLPHWMVFSQQSGTLAGLALTEDHGIYHLHVSVSGEKCDADFYLHILNKTLTDMDAERDFQSCSEGEVTVWANLLLQLNPVTLDGSQRLHLVTTLADYLHLPVGFVSLFSRGKSFMQQQRRFRVCRRGGPSEKADVTGDAAVLLWPVDCQREQGVSDLAEALEHSVKTGGLARFLEAAVLGWRVLCAPGGVQRRMKRKLHRLNFTPTPNKILPSPAQVHQTVKLDNSHTDAPPLQLEPSLSMISLHRDKKKTKMEPTPAQGFTERAARKTLSLQASGIFHLIFDGHDLSTIMHHVDKNPEMSIGILKTNRVQEKPVSSTSVFTFKQTFFYRYSKDVDTILQQQSVCVELICSYQNRISAHNSEKHIKQTELPSLKTKPLIEASNIASSVCKYLTTVMCFVGEFSSATLLTVSPSLPLTPVSHSVTSMLTHGAVDRGSHATRLTLRPHMKETSLCTESYRADHTDSESQAAVSSLGQEPTNNPNTVKPTHNLLSEDYNDALLPSSTLSNKITNIQPLPDESSTSYLMTEQLSTQQVETAQHLSPSPSGKNEDGVSQPNVGVSSATLKQESSLSTSLLEPSRRMFTPALPSQLSLFSGQFEIADITNFDQTQTLISGILLTSQLSEEMSIDSSVMLPEQPPVRPDHEGEKQTLIPTLQFEESQEMHSSFHISSVPGFTTSIYSDTTFKRSHSVTYTVLLPVSKADPASEGHFEPTTPSTAQKPDTMSSLPLMQSLHPSFPLSLANDHVYISECTPTIQSTNLENTMEHSVAFLTTYSSSMVFPSQSFIFESSGLFSSTQTFAGHKSVQPSSLPSGRSFFTITRASSKAVGLSSSGGQSSVQLSSPSATVSDSLNLPPEVLQSIPVLAATVGFPFHYSISPKTFLDPEDGEADALFLQIKLIDGPPPIVGTWLTLDGLVLRGVPLEVDLQFAPQRLLLVAQDRRGLSSSLPLTLDLHRSLVEPCHIFTLTAHRSLHSILRHRHMVDLLLRKLSRFFNSSSSDHLTVVSMMSGSTVVSWYNWSLCETGQTNVASCPTDQIQSMWLMMRSAGGSVNPEFRKAMLPEFPITKVGPVSYRHDCFSTTPTSGSSSNPAIHTTMNPVSGASTSLSPASNAYVPTSTSASPTSQQINSNQWMTSVFTALLVVCLLILIVLIAAVVLYFCRGRRRSRAANGLTSLQGRELSDIKPRTPPLFQPEFPPPPLRLWIDFLPEDKRPLPLDYDQGQKTPEKALQPRPPHYDFLCIN